MVLTNMGTSNIGVVKKTTQGRKKIEIKKIEEVNHLQVTFSKRRAGLFKKASELCVLTGAELAIMVGSPGGRVYAFGHPSPDLVVEKYLTGGSASKSNGTTKTLIYPQPPMTEFNQHYSKISKELEIEKKKKENIDETNMTNNGVLWWDEPIEDLPIDVLQQFVLSLEELKKKVLMRADELLMIKSSSLSSKSNGCVNQIPGQVVGLGNYDNMVYGSNTIPMMMPLGGKYRNMPLYLD